jgi:hypothetical protein
MNDNDTATPGFYSDGVNCYLVSNAGLPGQIIQITQCATPTNTPTLTPTNTPTETPTLTPTNTPTITAASSCILVGQFYRAATSADACSQNGILTNIYSNTGFIELGEPVYRNSDCSTSAIEAYYSDGVTVFYVIAGNVFDIQNC